MRRETAPAFSGHVEAAEPSLPKASGDSAEDVIERANDLALAAVDQLLDGAIREESVRRAENDADRLVSLLALTPGQAADLRHAVRRHTNGQTVPVPVPVVVDAFDSPLRSEIESILRPDQLAAYAGLIEQSRINWVESQAYFELARLQGARSYSQEEKDRIFDQLVEEFAVAASE